MDPIVRKIIEATLPHRREILEENRRELAIARSRVATLETYVVQEAEVVSALERALEDG